ncbi:hypothetical protein [uncultured Corynebacterium sp.]|uniref:hypothetical protein n=1 Tax=uncultured Corynebacterium sp. TaxID=159447 RepID=UPI0025D687DC|nr:hypothetical protein [uncultured Corynebacterium sp.]
MSSFTTHLTLLLDPGEWVAVEKRMQRALADLGMWNDGISARVQRNYCEEDNMLLDQHLALNDSPATVEEIHLVRVKCTGDEEAWWALHGDGAGDGGAGAPVELERSITRALTAALPEGTGWYGTTVTSAA